MHDRVDYLILIPAWLKNATYALAALAGVTHEAYTAFAVLMLFDVATGVLASAKCDGWRSITSRRLSFGIISKLLLLFIPLAIALAGKAAGVSLQSVISSAFMVLTLSELYSVIGNIYTVRTGVRVPEFDAVSVVLRNIRRLIEKLPSNE